MSIVKEIKVEGFRSLKNTTLRSASQFTAITGKNSTGKSNLLRALSLLFENEVEPGIPIDLARDLYASGPSARKKKRAKVEAALHLPDGFRFPKAIAYIEQSVGRSLRIAREWTVSASGQGVVDSVSLPGSDLPGPEQDEYGRRVLSLIKFRYLPIRTSPASGLELEAREIAAALKVRLKKSSAFAQLMKDLGRAAAAQLSSADKTLKRLNAPFRGLQLALPRELGDLFRVEGLSAEVASGAEIEGGAWGVGHQALLMFEVLYSIDTQYSRFFGWRQAVIWAVEEPETGLHRDLERELMSEFRDWSVLGEKKFQLFVTTHSPVPLMTATSGYWATMNEGSGETSFKSKPISELVWLAQDSGVASWTHPALSFPNDPVVIVEGEIDQRVLEHVAGVAGLKGFRFLPLTRVDPGQRRGGADSVTSYLKRHAAVAGNRSAKAPLLVLFDWDISSQQLEKARKAYGPHGKDRVFRSDPAAANSELGPDFRGIERFYPTSVVEKAVASQALAATKNAQGIWTVSRNELGKAKPALADLVCQIQDQASLALLARQLDVLVGAVET